MTLRELRNSVGLRQEDVAKKMNLSQGAISKWESGETKPNRKLHDRLAKLYNCTPEELVKDGEK